jgi:DNA-directed RNA polymerase specialized sigma24 family protein
VTDGQNIVQQLHRVAARLTSNAELQKDLIQEMFLHLVQEQTRQPGRPLGWHLKSCEFFGRNFLRLGRSIDSYKRAHHGVSYQAWQDDNGEHHGSQARCSATEATELDPEMVTRDILAMIRPHLTERQAEILALLLQGHGVRQIGRMLGITHPAVIKHRRKIALVAGQFIGRNQPAPQQTEPEPQPSIASSGRQPCVRLPTCRNLPGHTVTMSRADLLLTVDG